MNAIAELIHSCSPWNGYTFDPGAYIRAANKLISQQEAEVLAALCQYRDELGPPSGERLMNSTKIFLLLRVLFVPTDEQPFPQIAIGMPDDITDPPLDDWPLYPLTLVDDIPLLFVPVFVLAGDPEDPLAQIEYCEQHCHLRSKPLHPPDDPLDAADKLLLSDKWYRPQTFDRDLALLRAQVLRLVNPVLKISDADKDDFFARLQEPGVWDTYREEFSQLKAAWDANENRYVIGSE